MTRKAGRYLLTGAAFRRGDERYTTGDTVQLNDEEAERLAKAFRPVGAADPEVQHKVDQATKAVDQAERAVGEAKEAAKKP